MKTNMIQAATAIMISAVVACGLCSLSTGSYLTAVAVTVGYLAVAVVTAMIVADYRRSQRDYSV